MANNKRNQSPCLTCTRVENPSDCEIKTCKAWKHWFVYVWDQLHDKYIDDANRVLKGEGINDRLQ